MAKKKKSKKGEAARMYAAIAGHRVVFGQNDDHLAVALDVIDGKAPVFSGKNGLPETVAGESVILQGAALKFDFLGADPNAASVFAAINCPSRDPHRSAYPPHPSSHCRGVPRTCRGC